MEYDTENRSTFKKAKSLQKSLSLKKPKNQSNLVQEFAVENPDLREIYIDECLSDNDELHLLKVPVGFDTKLLVGNFINFGEKTKLNIENVKYIVEQSKDDPENVFILSKKPKLIHSTLILRKKRRKNRNIDAQEEPDKIIIEDEEESSNTVKKKKKRKIEELDLFETIDLTHDNEKRKKNKTKVEKHENQAIFDLLESYTDQKKKNSKNKDNKVPIAQQPDSVDTSINVFIDSLSSKKRKKKSKSENKTNPVILQNILLSPSQEKASNERIDEHQNVSVQEKWKKKSPSKKIEQILENIANDSTPVKKKTKKKLKTSQEGLTDSSKLSNEEKSTANISVTDGSYVVKKKKKAKKQNTESPKPNLNISHKAQEKSTNLNDVGVTLFSSPVRNRDEKNILIAEILNSVKKQIHLSPREKKRRKSVM